MGASYSSQPVMSIQEVGLTGSQVTKVINLIELIKEGQNTQTTPQKTRLQSKIFSRAPELHLAFLAQVLC